jgi:hypothetical protein
VIIDCSMDASRTTAPTAVPPYFSARKYCTTEYEEADAYDEDQDVSTAPTAPRSAPDLADDPWASPPVTARADDLPF